MNIKKPNNLNSSLVNFDDYKFNEENLKKLNKKHPFLIFKKKLEESWEVKNKEINLFKKNEEIFKETENLSMTFDALKNKSLISYIDAPWGSGKTYFIENLIKWIKIKDKEKKKKEISFLFGWDENKETPKGDYLDISVIDAWEIYNGNNINDILMDIFLPEEKEISENIYEILKEIKENKMTLPSIAKKTFSVTKSLGKSLLKIIPLNIWEASTELLNELFGESKNSLKSEKQKNKKEIQEILKDKNKKKLFDDILIKSIIDSIEKKYVNNNKIIFIDNIERLSSKNRLDVINKILNWSNISGTTFLFLTYFKKIKFSSLSEEDFWNKISLYETFNLTNDWKIYVDNYNYQESFKLSDYQDLKEFIKKSIPIFFSGNNDAFDIREIKKLLDNWINNQSIFNQKKMIISFFETLQKQMSGLEKYFFINKSITSLSEDFWKYWEEDLKKLSLEDEEREFTPLINNKMFRIQSNFFDLEIFLKEDKKTIKFFNENFIVRNNEIKDFKEFNNFIDDFASESYMKIINKVFKTRELNIELNKETDILFKYIEFFGEESSKGIKKINYFEFKYNNIKKLHIYNQIKKS